MSDCIHHKVYSNQILCSLPAQYQWICYLCGEHGTDKGTATCADLYQETVERFRKKDD